MMLNVISLGAGVQSTTMALLAAHGDLPMPDVAIFADTGAEPQAVYEHLRWLQSDNVLPFPVKVVSAGNIVEDMRQQAETWVPGRAAAAPFFTDGRDGRAAPLRRQCTAHYKIEPIIKAVREMIGLKYHQWGPREVTVRQWIGISTDEAHRMKPADVKWIENTWPLIDKRMSRSDCLRWLSDRGYSAPKSACTFCPYRSDAAWQQMKDTGGPDWREARYVDALIRRGLPNPKGGTGRLYVHRSRTPLGEVEFTDDRQADLFGEECSGMCGV